MPGTIRFKRDDLTGGEVRDLLEVHLAHARAHTPSEQVFALDLEGLRGDDMYFWTGWQGDALVAMGGLRVIAPGHGEIKSMHTVEALRGQGIAGQMLDFIMAEAGAVGLVRVSLETGSQAAFAPARALYTSRGFEFCDPLPGYPDSAWSAFMTRAI